MPTPIIQQEALVVGKDGASLRHTKSGIAVSNARLKFSDRRRNEQTDKWEDSRVFWTDATAWGEQAELLAEHGQGGAVLLVAGRMTTEEWEKDGQKQSRPCLVIESVLPKPQKQGGQSRTPAPAAPASNGWGSSTDAWGGSPAAGGTWGTPDPNQPSF